jgi:transposase
MLQQDKVIKLRNQGLTYQQIADALGIAKNTVTRHVVDYNKKHNLTNIDKVKQNINQIKDPKKLQSLNEIEETLKPHVPDHVDGYWDKTDPKLSKYINLNRLRKEEQQKAFQDALINVISGLQPIKFKKRSYTSTISLKGVTTDQHVGLKTSENYVYNKEIYSNNIENYVNDLINQFDTFGRFDKVILSSLGDEQDGLGGETTRGGHKLDQNESDIDVFEACINAKINQIHTIAEADICNQIILQDVINSNHSHTFAHMVNVAVKKIINQLYSSELVKIDSLTKFLNYRSYGKHGFIITHGKDSKYRTRGLPYVLDDKTINYINKWIQKNNIKEPYLHLEKGDLHRLGYQDCIFFDYYNYTSFAPPSIWAEHNFTPSKSGYTIQVINKNDPQIISKNVILDYSNKNQNKIKYD